MIQVEGESSCAPKYLETEAGGQFDINEANFVVGGTAAVLAKRSPRKKDGLRFTVDCTTEIETL